MQHTLSKKKQRKRSRGLERKRERRVGEEAAAAAEGGRV
jgi:hypothetical protein